MFVVVRCMLLCVVCGLTLAVFFIGVLFAVVVAVFVCCVFRCLLCCCLMFDVC